MAVGSLPGNSGNLDLEEAIQKLGPLYFTAARKINMEPKIHPR